MAGVDRPNDKERVLQWMKEILPGATCHVRRLRLCFFFWIVLSHHKVYNDGVIALACGTLGKLEGIVVISGTGTISVGFNPAGEHQRAAGWGYCLGKQDIE
jgi:N-acetylglucosamine kinase-like BadF-type ATPase